MIELDRLSLNQKTTDRWTVTEAVEGCVRAGIGAIGLWRDRVDELGTAETAALVRRAGLHVSSLCRAGFFPTEPGGRATALANARSAVEQAAALEADTLVLVCGGLPTGSRDLPGARAMVTDALDELVPFAARLGVRLGVEPLHPMFCADRSVITTLAQALDVAQRYPAETVGVVVDSYNIWWDPDVTHQIARAAGRIASVQVSDWLVPLPPDMLLGRGHLGDGHIDVASIVDASWAAGYRGFVEVEIFNAEVWSAPGDSTVDTVVERFRRYLC